MLSFYDPYDKDFDRSIWIRNSENIKVAHETFKKVGYRRLFLEYNYSYDWCWILGDVNKPCDEIIDSLLITHDSEKIRSKYYREFWDRRRTEQNDSIVFEVLKEVSIILCQDIAIPYNVDHVNDTLFKLIEIREFEDSLTDAKALENFNYLKSIGLYKSAYNLLFERYRYYDVEWNQEELKISLNSDTTNCCPWAFIEDSTK
ncbi:hypothetical protein P700755_000713 [Psychroflexus torquis ATCC 700755]|jgi:hypothetical protein|uniref:Uncharacterized protein n=2 Tax=Psychroflexus TaxID=83612 RepID=K4IF53_PSYTT|nr:hypothetical protein P700755_000713 [Psychroflexus torquis ATCC 700755]